MTHPWESTNHAASTAWYAGIGSRDTPALVLDRMRALGEKLSRDGWVLRSGGADGADQAFYEGADVVEGRVELYLPWPDYNGHDPVHIRLAVPARETYAIAEDLHPAWSRLSRGTQKLHARNVHVVTGPEPSQDLLVRLVQKHASSMVVCWTPDGATTEETTSAMTGGTGQAIRLASRLSIPVYNLARPDHWRLLGAYLG